MERELLTQEATQQSRQTSPEEKLLRLTDDLSNGQLLYRSAQPVPPNVRKRRPVKLPAGPVTECAFARWRKVYPFLSGHNDVIASFSCLILLRPLVS